MTTPDYLSRSGAHDLAEKIRRYWELRGLDVRMEALPANFRGNAMVFIRSDMVNGMPQRKLEDNSQCHSH